MKKKPYTEALSESALRGCMARRSDFITIKEGTKGELKKSPVPPPLDVVKDTLALGTWEFPALLGIVESPVVRPDGTILSRPGYDHATFLYHCPAPGLSVPEIPDCPTNSDLQTAVQLLAEIFCDFPFDSDASRANALAALLTPILRTMIDGPVPLCIIDKPQAGIGASLLAEVISVIATGRRAAMLSAQKDDEGWRKAIFSLLLQGQTMVTIDNIEGTLLAPSLAGALTAADFQDRILGRSEMLTLSNRASWLATGNNIKLGGDLPRRCVWVRMDAGVARPWQRDENSFKHPRLVSWVTKNRGGILAAILTIAQCWVAGDMPEAAGLPNLGSFEDYRRVIGGVLAFAGVEGFLGNLDRMYDKADTGGLQWEGFLEAWIEFAGEYPVSTGKIIDLLSNNEEFRNSLPDTLAGRDARGYSHRVGKALSRQDGVRYPNGLMIKKVGKNSGVLCGKLSDTSRKR